MNVSSPFLRGCWLTCLILLLTSLSAFAARIYVDASNTHPSQNGSNWHRAYSDLQAALLEARTNNQADEIWVATGTYHPTSGTDRSISFELVPGDAIYGGFAGTENLLEDRDPDLNITILSGDIGTPNDSTDNSYHVVTIIQQAQERIVIDGFHIVDGHANGSGNEANGAGLFIYASSSMDTLRVRVEACEFYDNIAGNGGGLACLTDSGAIVLDTIERINFHDNTAGTGGAMYQYKGTNCQIMSFVKNCFFVDNTASSNGGGIAHEGNMGTLGSELAPNLTVVNAVFTRNSVGLRGGCLFIYDLYNSFTLLRNLTCYGNVATASGPVYTNADNNMVHFQNSIAWSHTGPPFTFIGFLLPEDFSVINDCIIEGGDKLGVNVVDEDPDFLDPANDDFRLEVCSPGIDAGVNYGTASGEDIGGNDRIYNSQVDIGAYEFNATNISLPIADAGNLNLSSDGNYVDPDGWLHFYDCSNRYLLLSLHPNGQSLGNPDISVRTEANYGNGAIPLHTADYVTGNQDWWVINRSWKVENAATFNNPVNLRFYYDQEDVQDLIQSSGGVMTSYQDMTFYKIDGAGVYDTDVIANGGTYSEYLYSGTATTGTWTDSTYNGNDYAEFLVMEFSEGSAGWLGTSALPVEWSSFYGVAEASKVLLFWQTEVEINNDWFELEKSPDGQNFSSFYQTSSKGSGPNSYQTIDYTPFNGKNYYRIKQVDLNGELSYSEVVVVEIGEKREAIRLFPNPVKRTLNFQLPASLEGELTIRIIDHLGRELMRQSYDQGNRASYTLDVQELVAGLYTLRVDGKRYRSFTPFVVIN